MLTMGWHMANEDEIEPVKVRTGLFALVTARLEDAHETAVKGQAAKLSDKDIGDLIIDLRAVLGEINIQIDAIELMNNP